MASAAPRMPALQQTLYHIRAGGGGLLIVKRDGRREPFDRYKLLQGIRIAAQAADCRRRHRADRQPDRESS